MKTAISIPDDTFARAARRAGELGMSRSEFFSRAAARYLDELDAEAVTAQIDRALGEDTTPDESTLAASRAGRRTLDTSDW